MRRILRILAVLGLVALVVAVVRRLLAGAGEPPPAFTPAPPTPAPTPTPPAEVEAEPVAPDPVAGTPAEEAEETADEDTTAWSAPEADGSCPDGFPVKAKLSSQIFHVPGGLSYERTRPDRCYRDEAAAEADGLRRAKR